MDAVRELIVEEADKRGTTLAELSRKLGKNHAYLQQFVKRGIPAELPEMVRGELARLLGINEARLKGPKRRGAPQPEPESDVRSEDVAADLPSPARTRKVKVKGYVGASAEAHYYAVSDEDFEEVEAPAGATDQTVAAEIRGTSLGKLLNTWLIFYDDVRSPVTPDLIGELCVVGLSDDRILVKKIVRNRRGGFNLLANNDDPPIEDVKIEWAALVTDMRRR